MATKRILKTVSILPPSSPPPYPFVNDFGGVFLLKVDHSSCFKSLYDFSRD
jgi:hypothetical protein